MLLLILLLCCVVLCQINRHVSDSWDSAVNASSNTVSESSNNSTNLSKDSNTSELTADSLYQNQSSLVTEVFLNDDDNVLEITRL